MIAVAANSASTIANSLSVSWFDAVFLAVLGFGLFRGRRNGMSKELLPLLQWLALAIGCGLGYPTVAPFFIHSLAWSRLASDILGYLTLALVILVVFSVLKNRFTERLIASDFFKGGEYYLGMPAGMIRFACMLLAALALLNAPFYTPQEIEAQKTRARNNFGGGTMSGSFFPSLNDIQDAVFVQSASGHCIKSYLGALLIDTTGSSAKNSQQKQSVIHIGN